MEQMKCYQLEIVSTLQLTNSYKLYNSLLNIN